LLTDILDIRRLLQSWWFRKKNTVKDETWSNYHLPWNLFFNVEAGKPRFFYFRISNKYVENIVWLFMREQVEILILLFSANF
jgi:hypothetical protein